MIGRMVAMGSMALLLAGCAARQSCAEVESAVQVNRRLEGGVATVSATEATMEGVTWTVNDSAMARVEKITLKRGRITETALTVDSVAAQTMSEKTTEKTEPRPTSRPWAWLLAGFAAGLLIRLSGRRQ